MICPFFCGPCSSCTPYFGNHCSTVYLLVINSLVYFLFILIALFCCVFHSLSTMSVSMCNISQWNIVVNWFWNNNVRVCLQDCSFLYFLMSKVHMIECHRASVQRVWGGWRVLQSPLDTEHLAPLDLVRRDRIWRVVHDLRPLWNIE